MLTHLTMSLHIYKYDKHRALYSNYTLETGQKAADKSASK